MTSREDKEREDPAALVDALRIQAELAPQASYALMRRAANMIETLARSSSPPSEKRCLKCGTSWSAEGPDECPTCGPLYTKATTEALCQMAAAAYRTKPMLDKFVDRFLAWPLPQGVSSDPCATDSKYPYPRCGTNLLTADEARQMLEHVLNVQSALPEYAPSTINAPVAQTGERGQQGIGREVAPPVLPRVAEVAGAIPAGDSYPVSGPIQHSATTDLMQHSTLVSASTATPRTDAVVQSVWKHLDEHKWGPVCDLARQLERELAEAHGIAESANACLTHQASVLSAKDRELDAARSSSPPSRNDALEEAARVCDAHAETCERDNLIGAAQVADQLAKDIRALKSQGSASTRSHE